MRMKSETVKPVGKPVNVNGFQVYFMNNLFHVFHQKTGDKVLFAHRLNTVVYGWCNGIKPGMKCAHCGREIKNLPPTTSVSRSTNEIAFYCNETCAIAPQLGTIGGL